MKPLICTVILISQVCLLFAQDAARQPFAELYSQLEKIAAGAKDCGFVSLHQDPTTASKCALAADKSHKPFFVVYVEQGVDSDVATAFVLSSTGTLSQLSFDSFGTDPNSLTEGQKISANHHIVTDVCKRRLRILHTGLPSCSNDPSMEIIR